MYRGSTASILLGWRMLIEARFCSWDCCGAKEEAKCGYGGKERRESLVRAKRLCRVGTTGETDVSAENDMMIDEEQSILEGQTASAVEELKSATAYQCVNLKFPCCYSS
ncbi:hypothetical protein SLE2022_076930 [Rubroshorea leprosula]